MHILFQLSQLWRKLSMLEDVTVEEFVFLFLPRLPFVLWTATVASVTWNATPILLFPQTNSNCHPEKTFWWLTPLIRIKRSTNSVEFAVFSVSIFRDQTRMVLPLRSTALTLGLLLLQKSFTSMARTGRRKSRNLAFKNGQNDCNSKELMQNVYS